MTGIHRLGLALLLPIATCAGAAGDARVPVELPPMMQQHMLANMRDHLETLDALLGHLAADELDAAADLAEQRLGMSSLDDHGAGHMAQFMPEGMRAAGTEMHRAASRFARVAVEGDRARALAALREVSAACVACHRGYRLR
jgi:cytochrome c556